MSEPARTRPPDIAVIGPGAIGATLAGALQQAGHAPTLCGRTPLDRIVIEPDDGDPIILEHPVATDPAVVDDAVDVVIIAVKAHQTDAAAPWLERLTRADTLVVVAQNGVEHVDRVAPLVPTERVLPVIAWYPAEVLEPGRIHLRDEIKLTAPDDPDGRALRELLGPHARVDLDPDITTALWRKLVTNAVAGLCVLASQRVGVLHRPDVAELAERYARECIRVARAAGAVLDDDGHWVVEHFQSLPPDLGSSISVDHERGRALEWDARNGVVGRVGRRHGVPTPISDVVVPLLAAASDG